MSDHYPIKLNLVDTQEEQRGSEVWKLNCSLLKDWDYVKMI